MKIVYVCGHEGEILRPSSREEYEKIKAGKCPECKKREIAAAPRKAELNLPALLGTGKQIAWATEIRAKVIEHKEEIRELVSPVANDYYLKPYMTDYISSILDRFVENEKNASRWIDVFKPITSPYSDKPAKIHILGGMAQMPHYFGLDEEDALFLFNVSRYAK